MGNLPDSDADQLCVENFFCGIRLLLLLMPHLGPLQLRPFLQDSTLFSIKETWDGSWAGLGDGLGAGMMRCLWQLGGLIVGWG